MAALGTKRSKCKIMNKKELVIFSLIFAIVSFFTVNVVMTALTGKSLVSKDSIWKSKPAQVKLTSSCSSEPVIADLGDAKDPQLRKLAEHQQVCGSLATKTLMIFTDMPKDDPGARKKADAMVATLQEFAKYGVSPIVIVEPNTEWGLIDFKEFESGFYDAWIGTYFDELKKQGITDAQMGMWVPFPEANLPYWNNKNAQPADFAAIVNKYLAALRKRFPQARTSVLLDSATYETNDFDWSTGEYVSLRPYVKDIKKELVSSFGLQGFPWAPPATTPGSGIFDAATYLNYHLAQEAADLLGVKDVWFNTGTFGRKYTLDQEKAITVSPEKRKDMLNAIVAEAGRLRDRGYTVTINLFAEDKSGVQEATDWSYWHPDTIGSARDRSVYVDFVSRLGREKIRLSLFDRVH